MKSIKKITPEFLKRAYHLARSFVAALVYGFPAREMIIIGITGTKGKTSTGNYVWSVLRSGGYKAGLTSSAIFRIDNETEPNPYHMTMPDPFIIQKKLREMKKKGIAVAIVEMTSEGMKQYRHTGIPVDIAVFTNLTPEHLTSHGGSFEKYKAAKVPMFKALAHRPKKLLGKTVPNTIIANADSEHAAYYLGFPADKKITFGLENGDVREKLTLSIPGKFNLYNALPAYIVGTLFDIPDEKIREGLASLMLIPGRMELIDCGQDFTVVVDYAHEPASLGALLDAADDIKAENGKIILLIGVIGGGREPREPLAKLAAQRSDVLIITNEDPYDEDPHVLIERLVSAAQEKGKILNKNLFAILDRREAIKKALSLASNGDIVLISGKGAETTMMTKSGPISWDERAIVRELTEEKIHHARNN